jgi:ribonuclease BN (tRNA processing enzyme)
MTDRLAGKMTRQGFLKTMSLAAVCGMAVAMGGLTPSPTTAAEVQKQAAPMEVSGTRLILLGTAGGPVIRKFRSQPSSLLIVEGTPYLIDAGAGTLRQLAWVGYRPIDLAGVFITHHHLDHNADLGNIVSFDWIEGRKQPLPVYGPYGTKHIVSAALDYFSVSERIFGGEAKFSIPASQLVDAHDIAGPGLIYSDDKIKVFAAENSHFNTFDAGKDKSYAYRFETPGRTIVFTGDSGPSESLTALAKGADILVSEVIDSEEAVRIAAADSHIPPEGQAHLAAHMRHEHLAPEEVGKMATKAGVKMVVLTHIAPSDGSEPDAAHYTEGVKRYFNGPVIAGRDLLEL